MTIQEKRALAIARHENNLHDQGGRGRAFELQCARAKSRKCKVAEQNEIDVHIKFINDNGKVIYKPAECKTNGGRIDEILVENPRVEYVIYRLQFTQKLKNSVDERNLPAIVMPVGMFVGMLRKVNAIKVINKKGVFDGYGIQASSKKMYECLCNYIEDYGDAILFDNEKVFENWDFDGLEIRYPKK